MAYVPDATDVAQPTDAGVLAATAAAEFRTVKTYMRDVLLAGVNLRAPLASPALTGIPTAPTAVAGTNTTQLSTTAFVHEAIVALIGAAPGALDTLVELAAALANDANYATTITNALALKATIASPTFTGTVTAPVFNGAHNGTVGVTTPAAGSFTTLSATGALTTAGIKEDASGSVGFGVVPNAWGGGFKGLQVTAGLSLASNGANSGLVGQNWYYDGTNDRYVISNPSTAFQQYNGTHIWKIAPSGIAGAAITWNQAMTLDNSGNLLAGVLSGAYHRLLKGSVADVGNATFGTGGAWGDLALFFSVSSAAYSAANSAFKLGKDGTTNRSINAAGTVNASGADYAEYERNNGLTIVKGSIIGFKADGTLTDVFADAIRFAIKSTNPSYVGGDTWGSEDQVGKRPDEPQRIADKAEQREVTPAIAATEIEPAVEAIFETVILEAGDTDAEWAAKQADYATAKTAFEARLEAARQQVDRIAYSGKVPCNVMGAIPGGYIIASATAGGSIEGIFVADPDFTQYKKAVGRVNKIIDETAAKHLAKQINVADWQQFVGRCEVAVIIH